MTNSNLDNRILIFGCMDIFHSIRLPKMFCDAGFRVATLSYEQSLLCVSEFIDCRFYLSSAINQSSDLIKELTETILEYEPTMVFPGDAVALGLLVKLHQATREELDHDRIIVNNILNASLSNQQTYLKLLNKSDTLDYLSVLGISIAPYQRVKSSIMVYDFIEKYNLPIHVKADTGPEALLIKSTTDFNKLAMFFERIRGGSAVCIKQTGQLSVVTLISCNGVCTNSFAVNIENKFTLEDTPSIVYECLDERIIDDAKFIVNKFDLSGLVNIIFQTPQGQAPQFVECNLYPSITSHLGKLLGKDLAKTLYRNLEDHNQAFQAIGHKSSHNDSAKSNCHIALFPMAWQKGESDITLSKLRHDVPWSEPALLNRIMRKLAN